MVLSYANGPGYDVNRNATGRYDPRNLTEARQSMYYRFPATAPRDSETHGGDDVGIWAIGEKNLFFNFNSIKK
jgi:alkaline phosphatase